MNENTEGTGAPICGCCRRIPISHLALDVAEPLEGWVSFFAAKDIEVASDHLGRPSVGRHILARLLDEQRERRARLTEEAAQRAARMTAPVPVGVPAVEGASALQSMMAAPGYTSLHDELGRPKPNFLDEMLAQGRRQQAAARAEREAIDQARKVLEGKEVKKR
jgi:hypothetical protein